MSGADLVGLLALALVVAGAVWSELDIRRFDRRADARQGRTWRHWWRP